MHGCRCQGTLLCVFLFTELCSFHMGESNVSMYRCIYIFLSELDSL